LNNFFIDDAFDSILINIEEDRWFWLSMRRLQKTR